MRVQKKHPERVKEKPVKALADIVDHLTGSPGLFDRHAILTQISL